jgi:hypothetical protein
MRNTVDARLRRSRWLDALAIATIAVAWVLGMARPWVSPATWISSSERTPLQIAVQVGAAYGDPHARLLSLRMEQTDGTTFHQMYVMTITGHFHEGPLAASRLTFSALTDQNDVWAITAYDGNTLVWSDDQLPASYTQTVQTPPR